MNDQGGITLSAEEMKAFSITRTQVKMRRKERIARIPRMLILVCSVLEAEEIVENFPEVRILSPSKYMHLGQALKMKAGKVHGPNQGWKAGRRHKR